MGWLVGEHGGLPTDILPPRAPRGPGEQHLPAVAGVSEPGGPCLAGRVP